MSEHPLYIYGGKEGKVEVEERKETKPNLLRAGLGEANNKVP